MEQDHLGAVALPAREAPHAARVEEGAVRAAAGDRVVDLAVDLPQAPGSRTGRCGIAMRRWARTSSSAIGAIIADRTAQRSRNVRCREWDRRDATPRQLFFRGLRRRGQRGRFGGSREIR